MFKSFLPIAAFSGALAVALGAFGAHGLKPILSPELLESYKTGVQYQMYHAIALALVGIMQFHSKSAWLQRAGYLFILGTLLFPGCMYVYVLSGIKAFAIILPLGGISFMSGWLCLSIHAWRIRHTIQS